MNLTQRLRHQHLKGLSDKSIQFMAEQRLHLAIGKPDCALLVHPHQSISCRLQQIPEPRRPRIGDIQFSLELWQPTPTDRTRPRRENATGTGHQGPLNGYEPSHRADWNGNRVIN